MRNQTGSLESHEMSVKCNDTFPRIPTRLRRLGERFGVDLHVADPGTAVKGWTQVTHRGAFYLLRGEEWEDVAYSLRESI